MSATAVTEPADNQQASTPLWIDPRYRELFAHNGLRTLDDLFVLEARVRFEKASLPSWRERLAVDLSNASGSTQRLYVKRFHRPPAEMQRRRIFAGHARRSTAGVERFWIEALRADGIEVPRVAAFGEEREGIHEGRSALVLVAVPGDSLERWVTRHGTQPPGPMIEALARFVGRFHQLGYIHRDLYLSHIFLSDGDSPHPRFVLIDLQRVMKNPFRHRRWRAHDLAQLDYSVPQSVAGPRQRLRFLRAYLGIQSLRGREPRSLVARVGRMSARIAAREARRRRKHSAKGSSVA